MTGTLAASHGRQSTAKAQSQFSGNPSNFYCSRTWRMAAAMDGHPSRQVIVACQPKTFGLEWRLWRRLMEHHGTGNGSVVGPIF
jgi:hypothetical protein